MLRDEVGGGKSIGRSSRRRPPGNAVAALVAFSLVAVGCGASTDTDPAGSAVATPAPSSGEPATSPPPTDATGQDADATPAVVTLDDRLQFTDDPSTTASALVPAASGGSITVTANDGTVFTFDVPPGALGEDTTITATAAAEVTGISGVTVIHAVRLEPAGLRFNEPARLRIDPMTPIASGFALPFTAAGDGSEPHLTPLDDGEGTVLSITHFSRFGVGELVQQIADVIVELRTQNAENEMFNRITQDLEIRRAARNAGVSVSEADSRLLLSMTEYLDKVFIPLASSSSGTCASMQSVASRLLTYHLIAKGNSIAGVTDTSALVQGQILAMEKVCEKERIAQCKAERNPQILVQFWINMWTYKIPAGFTVSSNVARDRERAREICLPKAYDAVGGADDFVGNGKICDIGQPFVISGSGVSVNFTPTSESAGTYTYTGSAGGVALGGEGTYTVTLTDSGGKIDGYGPGHAGDARGTGSEVYTLTPIPPC